MGYAWLGIICYAFVIYFDFSGYSDMAIGLCNVFGFKIAENFNHPYTSTSLKEFWRRWHISLSEWFRDYVYIPLGGSRSGQLATYKNLLIVFVLTGIWHGASWTFVTWGLIHGVFRLIESTEKCGFLKKSRVFGWLYTCIIVLVGWVFFRADSLNQALVYIKSMFTLNHVSYAQLSILRYFNLEMLFTLSCAILFSMPIQRYISNKFLINRGESVKWIERIFYLFVFIIRLAVMLSSSFNPSIYTKF